MLKAKLDGLKMLLKKICSDMYARKNVSIEDSLGLTQLTEGEINNKFLDVCPQA